MKYFLFIALIFSASHINAEGAIGIGYFRDHSGIKTVGGENLYVPLALLYDENGKLINSLGGSEVYHLPSYVDKKLYNPLIISPKLSQFLKNLDLNEPNNNAGIKKTIVYVDMPKRCPPCASIGQKFEENVASKLDKSVRVIKIDTWLD